MKRFSVLLVVVALASFALYWVERPASDAPPAERTHLVDSGLAWVDGNQSSAFFVVNASKASRLDVDVLAEAVPPHVWIWNESDQARFGVFAQRLERRLLAQSISVQRARLSDLRPDAPGVLVVAGSAIPAELLQNDLLFRLLDGGWVVLHSGFPFSWVRIGSRIEPNAVWPSQRERLGFDFDRTEATADFSVSVRRGSLRKSDSWQVFGREPGVLAFWPGLLDASYSDADATAERFEDFIAHARWSPPIVSFSANVSSPQTVFSPAFLEPAREAMVFLTEGNTTRRIVVEWSEPSLRITHPFMIRSNATILASILSNLSSDESFELSVLRNGHAVTHRLLGGFASGLSWHSFPLEAPGVSGSYVLRVSGSKGTRAYSLFRIFSYRVQIGRTDASSKSVWVRLWAAEEPVSGQSFEWRNQTAYTDSEGFARLTDPDFSGGNHRRVIRLDGQDVPFEYSVQVAFLSSWTDRALLAAIVGLFGLAWFFKRRQPSRIRLTPAAMPMVQSIVVTPPQLKLVMENTRARLKRGADVLSVREFRDGLERFLCGPTNAFTDDSLAAFLSKASGSGQLYFRGSFLAWPSWLESESGFSQAVFWRRLSDALTLRGWTFRRNGLRVICRKGASRMTLCVAPREGRIRLAGSKKDVSLDEWCTRLDS